MSDPHPLELAAHANREALFAGLQAALLELVDAIYGRNVTIEDAYARVNKALRLGHPYGSPEHLASLAQRSDVAKSAGMLPHVDT